MVGATYLLEHRTWEDWAMIVLGLVIGLTPWFVAGATNELIALNAVVGALIIGFFLKPNRFAYGEKFFTEEGQR
jgi:hypothetical protein